MSLKLTAFAFTFCYGVKLREINPSRKNKTKGGWREENIPEGQRDKKIPCTWRHEIFSTLLLPFRSRSTVKEGVHHAMPVWPSSECKQMCSASVVGIFLGQSLHTDRLKTQQCPRNALLVSPCLLLTLNVMSFSSPVRGDPPDWPQAWNWIPRSLPKVTLVAINYLPLIVVEQIWLQAEFWPSGLHDMYHNAVH